MDSRRILSGRALVVGPPDASLAITTMLEGQEWSCVRAHSVSEAMWRLRNEAGIDVVVIAPGGQLTPHIDLCRHIKLGRRSAFVSVVFVLDQERTEQRVQIYEAGADDCIQLPASPAEIMLRLINAVRVTHSTDSLEDATSVITALANAIEGKDAYTCGHVERVATYAVQIGQRMGADEGMLVALRTGALVHDIGKVVVPDHVLNKPGKLTHEEMTIVRRHPVVGHDILQPLRTFQEVLPIVRWHHERPNGTGYPDGIEGNALPLPPRIVAVADCFDALTTDRPYRPRLVLSECLEILTRDGEWGNLDRDVVGTLLEMVGEGVAAPVGV